jgi:hypothetical protein
MPKRFISPLYKAKIANGEEVTIDVTNSISAGLDPNSGLLDYLIPFMRDSGYKTVLDFGAGALRHTIPLLKEGFEVIVVEYENAFKRPKAKEYLDIASKYPGFTPVVWPHDFLKSNLKYDVALLMFVLQVIPQVSDRELVLKSISKRFNNNGPRRLCYASRYGESATLPQTTKFNDGWVKGRSVNDRTFYTEWNAAETHAFFKRFHYKHTGNYKNASQPYLYDFKPGVL